MSGEDFDDNIMDYAEARFEKIRFEFRLGPKDAGERAFRVIAAPWRRHGGPAGLAETFLR